jgi:hypothetical protein
MRYAVFVAVGAFLLSCTTVPRKPESTWLSNTDKWDYNSAGKTYSIQRVTVPRRHLADSLRFQVRPGDHWTHRGTKSSRAEVTTEKYVPINSTQWYGFSVLLPDNFPIEDNRLVLAQWWSKPKRKLGEISRSPALALRYRDDRLFVTVRHSHMRVVTSDDETESTEIFETGEFKRGKWNDFVFQVKWSHGPDGFVNMWWNGKQVASYTGPIGYNDDVGPSTSFGIYRDESPKTYISYVSEYRNGDSYEAVDPSIAR